MSASYTPGPWKHVPGILKDYVCSEDGELQCSIQQMHPRDGHDTPAGANCRLIAAAPDLLEALIEADWVIKQLAGHEQMAILIRGYKPPQEDIERGARARQLIDAALAKVSRR